MIILAICIKVDSKGPVFYRQERVTTNGKLFRIFKFRTMVQNADKIGNLVTVGEDKRITRVGKFIRKFRLDEFDPNTAYPLSLKWDMTLILLIK